MPEPTKVTDIEIGRVYEVYCAECGVIDAPPSYKTALRSRRQHFEHAHAKTAQEARA